MREDIIGLLALAGLVVAMAIINHTLTLNEWLAALLELGMYGGVLALGYRLNPATRLDRAYKKRQAAASGSNSAAASVASHG